MTKPYGQEYDGPEDKYIPIGYTFHSFQIPDYMMPALLRYTKQHIKPGDFLTAVICNDLHDAVARADEDNQRNLAAYIGYFVNEAPSACWGSKEKMKGWLEV